MRLARLLLFLWLCAFPAVAQQEKPDPLTVSFVPIPPFAEFTADGTRSGFLIELARMIGAEIGVEIEFVDGSGVADFVQWQISGETQMIAGIAQIPPLRQTNLFSDIVATETLRPVILEERAAEFTDQPITGQRIGIVPPALGSQETEFLSQNEAVEFESAEAAVMGLLIGNVDVLLMPEPVAYSIARRAGADGRIRFVGTPLQEVNRFVALHESRADLLEPINAAISAIRADGRLAALQEQFNITTPAPPDDVLVVGVTEFPPYQTIGPDGTATGFAVDVLRSLAEKLGLVLEFKPITREEWQLGPGPGRYDILTQTSINAARQERMDFTLPIEQSANSIFMRAGEAGRITGLADLAGLRVAAQVDSQASRVAQDELGDALALVADRDALIDGLIAGEFDAVLFSTTVFRRLLEARGLEETIEAVAPPFHLNQRAPALRFGLGSIRDQFDAIIPGFLLSDEYAALRQQYFETPAFWTRTRVLASLGISAGVALAVLAIMGGLTLRTRVKTAAAVAAMRDELETIFNVATSGIVAFDTEGLIARVNARARHMLGGISTPTPFPWPDKICFLDAETMKPLEASADPVRRALAGHTLRNETHLMRRDQKDDDRRYVRVGNAKVENAQSGLQTVIVIDDVSNEERNRQVVERKSRLDALGQLTGGIAHDFNNLLAAQLYAVDLARKAKDVSRRESYLETAASSIQRGRALTTRLLSFARRQPGLASVKRTAEVFKEFEALVRPMLEAQIEISFVLEEEDPRHYCDQVQLETALMNLVLNARDAILRSGHGSKITIAARPVRAPNRELDNKQQQSSEATRSEGASFRYVEISVSDNGPGMDEEVLARCTDPFFTTKDTNSGTGLGLAMVYGFVRQSDGDLRIYSELDMGTTIQMTLPRGTEYGAREEAMPEDDIEKGSGQTILVVEDEAMLLLMMTDVLEDLGYEVVTATSGQAALDLLEEGTSFDLLLTDVVMPGKIGGFELARQVRAQLPDIPVIYSSGYTGFTASEMGEVQGPLLQKPAPPALLAEAISQALANAG